MTIVRNPAGASRSRCAPSLPTGVCIRAVTDCMSGLVPPNVLATSRSFHTQRNWKIPNEAIAGIDNGSTIDRKIRRPDRNPRTTAMKTTVLVGLGAVVVLPRIGGRAYARLRHSHTRRYRQ